MTNRSLLAQICLCLFYLASTPVFGEDHVAASFAVDYNREGTTKHFVKPDGVIITQRYTALGHLQEYSANDGSFEYHYSYDDQGNLVKIEDRVNRTETYREFDAYKRIVKETLGNGLQVANAFDAEGRRERLTFPDGSYVVYAYDFMGLTSISRFGSDDERQYTHVYSEYDLNGDVLEMSLIGAAGIQFFEYDDLQRCRSIKVGEVWSQEIPPGGIDSIGNIVAMCGKDGLGDWSAVYGYDDSNRLTFEVGPFTNTYTYDDRSNRIQKNDEHFTINHLDQIEGIEYDLNGNVTARYVNGSRIDYRYDAIDRLVSVEHSENTRIVFTYDAFHRRLSKQVFTWDRDENQWQEIARQFYFYDGNNEIGAVNEEGITTELRVLGVGVMGTGQRAEIGASVALEIGGAVYVPVHDHRGNVCSLLDASTGGIVEMYRYSAFGEVQIYSASGVPLEKSEVLNPWMFSSKRFDVELGFVFYGKRYYDPEAGRWLTKDPLGSYDGPNPYVFLRNDPLASLDLFGLFSLSSVWKATTAWLSAAFSFIKDIPNKWSYTEHIKEEWNHLAHTSLGSGYLQFLGYYEDPHEVGCTSFGKEIGDKVRVTFLNGILNIREDLEKTLRLFSKTHGDTVIHYVYHPTEGFSKDMISALFSRFGYSATWAKLLAEKWKEMIEEMGGVNGGGTVVHYSHSIGSADTMAAKHLLTPEEQRMIHVVTLGSPVMIPNNSGFGKVVNYASKRDGVCMVGDPLGYIKGLTTDQYNVELAGSFWGVPFVEHTLFTDAYLEIIRDLGTQFVSTFGQKK